MISEPHKTNKRIVMAIMTIYGRSGSPIILISSKKGIEGPTSANYDYIGIGKLLIIWFLRGLE